MDGGLSSRLNRVFLVAALLINSGCATNGDLEALRTQVTRVLTQTRQQMQSRVGALEDMKHTVEAQEKWLIARQAQERRVDVLEAAVTRSLDQQLLLSEDMVALRTALQERNDRFLLLLDAQEHLYQEGLHTLQAIREQLSKKPIQMGDPGTVSREPNSPVAPPAAPESDLLRPKVH